jgi:hypothetical protein
VSKRSSNGDTATISPGEVVLGEGATANVEGEMIVIEPIQVETIHIPIVGMTPLIMHNWSDKAKKMLLATKQNKKSPKEICDPQAEYEASMYRIRKEDDSLGFGMPAAAFAQATVGAARFYGRNVTMTALRQFLFVEGRITDADQQILVEVYGEPEMREDHVRLSGRGSGADLRYRACFRDWSAILPVTYVKTSIDRNSVVSLVEAGGMGVGVGDWRREKGGSFGSYEIDRSQTIGLS